MTEKAYKRCPKCCQTKPVDEFARNRRQWDGLHGWCRLCKSAADRARYYADLDKARGTARKRMKAGSRSAEARQRRNKLQRAYAAANREKVVAQRIVNCAVEAGTLERPKRCEGCGVGVQRIEAHHSDYSKPMEVAWLCTPCHNAQHPRT